MSELSNVAGLVHYLRRAPDRTSDEELIARDAWMAGYRTGYRHGGRDCLAANTELNTMLSDRRFATALATVAQFMESAATAVVPVAQPQPEPEIEIEWLSKETTD